MISIRLKPAFRFQASCSSSIRKRQIRSSLCDATSSLTRMRSRARSRVAFSYASFYGYLGKRFIFLSKTNKKRSMRLFFTCGPRFPGLSAKVQVSWRYRLSRCSSDRCVLKHWRSFAELSVGVVLDDGALRRSLNPADVLLSCSSDWGYDVFSFHPRLLVG